MSSASESLLAVVHSDRRGRVVVADSVTHLRARDVAAGPDDVLVVGSFAGALALGLALERGVRAVVAHEAGVGRDRAGISGLAVAERLGVPAAAVATMSARLGDGASVLADGVVTHVNAAAAALGVASGVDARAAARAFLGAPRGHVPPRGAAAAGGSAAPPAALVDRTIVVVEETARGRVVLVPSMSFADASYAGDVLCAGSHAGAVNARPVLRIAPRGALFHDGGFARDRSGVSGLAVLDAAGIAAAAVDAMSARIGDPRSLWETGVVSACNHAATARGVRAGQDARAAARRMLDGIPMGGS